jgi:phosphoglycerate dehydrogenase-like enzyme
MKIVIPDKIELDASSRKKLESIPDIQIFDDVVNKPETIIKRIRDAEVVTANYIDLTAEVIKNLPKLKYIISPAVGYDWIDSKVATERGIKILNCPTFNTRAVAEHAIALMFAVSRQLVQANNSILDGRFDSMAYTGAEVGGKTLVCIGNGNIGSKIQIMAKSLGMETDYIDTKTTAQEFEEKISKADVLVVSVPLNEKTEGLINKDKLSLLKPSCIVINVARGLVIDQEALYEALTSGSIAGAGIDTFPDDQTIKKTNDQIMKFAKLPNVVSTPHMAFNTKESAERLGDELIRDIESCIGGDPVNVVN